jgi:hypothetical protein
MNLGDMRTYVRDLTGVYSTDIISDTLLTRWINEVYDEVARSQNWSWLGSKVPLVNNGDSPVFDAQYHLILPYRVSSKVLKTQADDTKRGEVYDTTALEAYAQMVQDYFNEESNLAPNTKDTLTQLTRDLLREYSKELGEDLIKMMLTQSYIELANMDDWAWLEQSYFESQMSESNGNVVTISSGARKILEVSIYRDRKVKELMERPWSLNLEPDGDEKYYAIQDGFNGPGGGGQIIVVPGLISPADIQIRYILDVSEWPQNDILPFGTKFAPLLAYMAAFRLGTIYGAEQSKLGGLQSIIDSMLSTMRKEYILTSSLTSFQLGETGMETRKYFPWFRTP